MIPMPETHVYVQITDKCNQHCVFCNRPPKMGVTKDIPIEKIIKRIDEIKGKATRLIFTGGEIMKVQIQVLIISI